MQAGGWNGRVWLLASWREVGGLGSYICSSLTCSILQESTWQSLTLVAALSGPNSLDLKKKIYTVALRRLFLVAESQLLFGAVWGLLIAVAPLVAKHRL